MPKEHDSGLATYLTGIISALDRIKPVVRWANLVASVLIFLTAAFIFADVLLRYIFNRPITGDNDFIRLALVTIVFLAAAYPQLEGNHIFVDLITTRLRPKAAVVVDTTTSMLSILTIGIIVWQGIPAILGFINTNTTSSVYDVPTAPFAVLIPVGCTLLFLLLLRSFLNKIVVALRLNLGGRTWLLICGVPLLVIALLMLWMLQVLGAGISAPMVGVIAVLVMFVLIYFGMQSPLLSR